MGHVVAVFQTDFGRWLERRGIAHDDAARVLGLTRPYVSMLATGKNEPSLTIAGAIEDWSRRVDPCDVVLMHSFVGAKRLRALALGR